MSNASELNPMNQDRQRHPKACKIQMFTRHEQVWLNTLDSILKGRQNQVSIQHAINCADDVLKAFKNKFEK